MINFDNYANENNVITFKTVQELCSHNSKWPYILDDPYRILIPGGSRSGKTSALLNLISNQSDIDKIDLYAKDPMKLNTNFY